MFDWTFLPAKSEKEAVKWLHRMYLRGISSTKLANTCGVTDVTIRNLFKRYNLRLKKQGGHYTGKHIEIPESDYKALTYAQLAKKYECSHFTVYHCIKKYLPKRVRRSPMKGKEVKE